MEGNPTVLGRSDDEFYYSGANSGQLAPRRTASGSALPVLNLLYHERASPSPNMDEFKEESFEEDPFTDIPIIETARSSFSDSSDSDDDGTGNVDGGGGEDLSLPEVEMVIPSKSTLITTTAHRMAPKVDFRDLSTSSASFNSTVSPLPPKSRLDLHRKNKAMSRQALENMDHREQQRALHPFQPTIYQAASFDDYSSPVLRVFKNQPVRYFPTSASMIQSNRRQDLRSESLEVRLLLRFASLFSL
jgi:hypothetical protein